MQIAYLQDLALLASATSPELTGYSMDIVDIVDDMSDHLDNVKADAKEIRLSQISEVDCVWTTHDQEQNNVLVKPKNWGKALRYPANQIPDDSRVDSYTFKDVDAYYCSFKNSVTDEVLGEGYSNVKLYFRGDRCYNDSLQNEFKDDGGFVIFSDDDCMSGKKVVAKIEQGKRGIDDTYPESRESLEVRIEGKRIALILEITNEPDKTKQTKDLKDKTKGLSDKTKGLSDKTKGLSDKTKKKGPSSVIGRTDSAQETLGKADERFVPYDIMMEDLLKLSSEISDAFRVFVDGGGSGTIITAEMDEEITSGSGETTPRFCDQMSISELINSGNYANVVDNRQDSSAQIVDGTDKKDLYLASSHGDTFIGKGGNDCIIGGEGNDNLQGRGGDDQLYGRGGDDNLVGNSENDNLLGGDGDDTLAGGPGNDWLHGGPGNDTLLGRDGDDNLRGGDGNDTLKGENGNDDLRGEDGDDNLLGGNGDDTLSGGPGNDSLQGGPGIDELYGGEIDTCADPDDNTVIQECLS